MSGSSEVAYRKARTNEHFIPELLAEPGDFVAAACRQVFEPARLGAERCSTQHQACVAVLPRRRGETGATPQGNARGLG